MQAFISYPPPMHTLTDLPSDAPSRATTSASTGTLPQAQKPVIRRLVSQDADAYRAFRLRGLRECPDAFTSDYDEEGARPAAHAEQRLATSSGDKIWGAFVDAELVGMVGLNPETRQKNKHKAVLFGMFVAPEFSGCGLGRALVNVLLADARKRGIEQLVLTVTEGNKPATALYKKSGFLAFGTEPDAVRVDGISHGKTHMYCPLHSAAHSTLAGVSSSS